MFKRIISGLMLISMLFTMLPTTAFADANVKYGEAETDKLIFDFSTQAGVTAANNSKGEYSALQRLSGEGSRKSGGEWTKLTIPNGMTDWSGYTHLQMTIYSEYITGESLACSAVSENNETASRDEYHYQTTQIWQGWEVVTFDIDDTIWGTPMGLDKIDYFLLQFGEVSEVYIDRIWITTEPAASLHKYERDDSVDYKIAADEEYKEQNDYADFALALKYKSHPRLVLDEDGFNDLKGFVITVPYVKRAYANVKAEADDYLDDPVSTYVRKATDTTAVDKTSLNRLYPLAMTYKIEGDAKYKNRLWNEIEQIAKWEQMTLNDNLGLGDYARALALCYDWLYNDWSVEQKRIIRNVLMKNFLETSVPSLLDKVGVFGNLYNHNFVTNSGIGMCALAFGDETGYGEYCNQIIDATIDSMTENFKLFGPDGVSEEGVDYFEYGQDGVSLYLAAMQSALGTDMDISKIEGRDKMGNFIVAANGAVQSFDFSDSHTELRTPSELLFLAGTYDDKKLAAYAINKCEDYNALDIRDMLYFKEWMTDLDGAEEYPRDFNLKSTHQPMASARSSYDNRNAMYVGFKGGSQAGHSDLDYGSFVYDALGVRWFHDSGIDDYGLSGMFNYSAVSNGSTKNRWYYYSKRAEGHNTLVINPKIDKGNVDADQDVGTDIPTVNIDTYATGENYMYGIMDLTGVYTERVASAKITSAKRGIALLNNRSILVVQDEIKCEEPIEAYSFLHTNAEIEISDDKKSAILTKNNKKIKATLQGDGELLAMDAKALNDKYNHTGYTPAAYSWNAKKGMHKLAIHVENVVNPVMSIVVQPMYGEITDSLPVKKSLDEWGDYKDDSKKLVNEIRVGGKVLGDFRAGNTQYAVNGSVKIVEAIAADDGVAINITQADNDCKTAYVRAEADGYSITYCVEFSQNYTITSDHAENMVIGDNSCTLTIDNKGVIPIDAVLIGAVYSKGILTDAVVVRDMVNISHENVDRKKSISATVNADENDDEVRFYLWDNSNSPFVNFTPIQMK